MLLLIYVAIYDISGRIVANQNIGKVSGSQNIKLALDNLSPGNYMIRVVLNNQPVSIEKLIIK